MKAFSILFGVEPLIKMNDGIGGCWEVEKICTGFAYERGSLSLDRISELGIKSIGTKFITLTSGVKIRPNTKSSIDMYITSKF